jgi:hypothetical protein
MKRNRLHAGDPVVVRSPEEILKTLDADGTLDGLPFMPEMLDWCGKPLRVEHRVEKTCVAVAPPVYPNRRFAANDVVLLAGSRCDGSGHDGCKRACKIFWKEAWLRPLGADENPTPAPEPGRGELLARLKTKTDESHYSCQSTQLLNATEAFPGRKSPWMVRIALREILNGDRSVVEMLKVLFVWSSLRFGRVLNGKQKLRGPNKNTPSHSLGLITGDPVRIKSRAEIAATLNQKRSNRGMGICREMTRYCGAHAEVRERVDRIINETTGEMREVRDTVLLQNVRTGMKKLNDWDCLCEDELGDCPRGELMYWREIWLERAE